MCLIGSGVILFQDRLFNDLLNVMVDRCLYRVSALCIYYRPLDRTLSVYEAVGTSVNAIQFIVVIKLKSCQTFISRSGKSDYRRSQRTIRILTYVFLFSPDTYDFVILSIIFLALADLFVKGSLLVIGNFFRENLVTGVFLLLQLLPQRLLVYRFSTYQYFL